jgi:HlyD family secretion protein
MEIGDVGSLEVVADVLSTDAVRIEPGMAVRFERWGGDAPLEGVVRIVEPAGFTKISALGVEEQRTRVIADFTSPPEHWRRLGDGFRLEARYIIWQGNDVLQVPGSALFRNGDGWAVFVVENGRARLRTVEIGHRSGFAAEIRNGVAQGATVITHPADLIADGVRVRSR